MPLILTLWDQEMDRIIKVCTSASCVSVCLSLPVAWGVDGKVVLGAGETQVRAWWHSVWPSLPPSLSLDPEP